MTYRSHLQARVKQNVPQPVQEVIVGREADMAPSSAGAGFAFKQVPLSALKRWLVLGSASSTMYATAEKSTMKNLDMVQDILRDQPEAAINMIVQASVENWTPKQDTLLTAIAMALSFGLTGSDYIRVDWKSNTKFIPTTRAVHQVGIGNGMIWSVQTDQTNPPTYRMVEYDLTALNQVGIQNMKNMKGEKEKIDHPYMSETVTENGWTVTALGPYIRRLALVGVKEMTRQSSQLAELIGNMDHMRGWGEITHKVILQYLNSKDDREIAYQFAKYKKRGDWEQRDFLRKVRPTVPNGSARSNIYGWVVGKYHPLEKFPDAPPENEALRLLWATDYLKTLKNAKEVAKTVSQFELTREMVEQADTAWLNNGEVWEALLEHMPMTAMIRSLRKMADVGVLLPLSNAEKFIADRLKDPRLLKNARIHPIKVLQAAVSYDPTFTSISLSSRSVSYRPSSVIVDALGEAFELSFGTVEPLNKRMMISMDYSASMFWEEHLYANDKNDVSRFLSNDHRKKSAFYPLLPGEIQGTLAMLYARREPQYYTNYFASSTLGDVPFTKKTSLREAVQFPNKYHGGYTDISLPITWALSNQNKLGPVDVFLMTTDNEVNHGVHPAQALKRYRAEVNKEARMVVLGMTANEITVADPNDLFSLDVVGFSTDTPSTIADFMAGKW